MALRQYVISLHFYALIFTFYMFLDPFNNVSFNVFSYVLLFFLSVFVFVRFITILYFLNDVEEGGQTAFLMADNTTITPEVCN